MSENTRSIFLAEFAGQGVHNMDPMVWLDEARPPPKVILRNFELSYGFSKVIIYELSTNKKEQPIS
jgi:hypothetical protein